jgi:hypothetical protein
VEVPPAGPDVCPVCHGYRRRGFELCLGCQRVRRQVTGFCQLVVPVTLARSGTSPLYRVLCSYKDDRRPERLRRGDAGAVAALLSRFVSLHGGCIARAASACWDCVATVPSSGAHRGVHPLVRLVAATPGLCERHVELLERGRAPIGHLQASDDGYVAADAAGRRVLLVDDTYTSGARAQSAASALRLGGARVVAILAVARLVRPGFVNGAAFWQRQRLRGFDPATCCLEARRPVVAIGR